MSETRNWTWHLITAVVILFFLGLHMLVMHFDDLVGVFLVGRGAIAWRSVIARSQSGFFAVSYVVLLAAALYHGLYGLRTILFELSLGASARRALTGLCWIAGVGLFGIGTYAAIAAYLLTGVA